MVVGGAGHQGLVKQNILTRLYPLMPYNKIKEGPLEKEIDPRVWREVVEHVEQAITLIVDEGNYAKGPLCVSCGQPFVPTHRCFQYGRWYDGCMTNAQLMNAHEGACHRHAAVMAYGLAWVLRQEELHGVNW